MNKQKYSGIGGQAVMEGIMMRNEDRYSVAVRKSDGEIEIMTEDYRPVLGGSPVTKLPFIRGIFVMINSMVLGIRTLNWSAEFVLDEDEEDKEGSESSKKEKIAAQGGKEKDNSLLMGLTVLFSLVISVVVFMLIPYFVTELLRKVTSSAILLAVAEGVLRLLIFVGYVAGISVMEDIRRVYMYHGAEHKCINCIESGKELNVDNVLASSRLHPRCGTSFMLFVMLISIVLFFFIRSDNMAIRLLIRLALIPVIAGISYEVIRLAGKTDNIIVRILSAPGLALQRITTREPDGAMAEVAIKAVEAVFDWREYLKENFG